jgi:hypothetical protein
MHRGGVGITCFIKPIILSIFDRRSLLSSCSSCFLSMPSMLDQRICGFLFFSFVASLCTSMISSFKTHSRGRPGFLACVIKLRLFTPKFKQLPIIQNESRHLLAARFLIFLFPIRINLSCFFDSHFSLLISAESEIEVKFYLARLI